MDTDKKPSKQFKKYAGIITSGHITEQEILNLKRLLNGWSTTSTTEIERDELRNLLDEAVENGGLSLTPEQTAKGLAWLKNEWKTPRGQERKHNPFGMRETDILDNFESFRFVGFVDNANMYMRSDDHHDYQPIYKVISNARNDNDSFEYTMVRGSGYNGGSVEILA